MNASTDAARNNATRGFWFGIGAYGLWGILPIYFKAIADVGAVEIVAENTPGVVQVRNNILFKLAYI